MKARAQVLALAAAVVLAAPPADALTVQEAILLAKPAVALVTARVDAEITMNCGRGPLTVKPAPFVETGTGWFIDGRGFLITNAHVVDPVQRLPPWVTHELKAKAIDQGCVDPALRERGLMRGQQPDVEDALRRAASERALPSATFVPSSSLTVLLSNGSVLAAQVVKFSAPPLLDVNGQPLRDSGRDLALLQVREGVYPAIALSTRDANIGDPVHILGFPGVVLSHELLNKSVRLEAVVTNGAVSGFQQDIIGQDVIQTDAPAAHGNSGGPAITDSARLVGVMSFLSLSAGGSVLQGFNFLIPARDVAKFVRGTPVRPGASAFNPVWAAGLDAFFDQRYKTAFAKISEANALLPDLVDVKRMLAEADAKVKNPPPQPFPWIWVAVGVTLVSVGAYSVMFLRRWWKSRYRILPAQVIASMERGQNPLLLDVRTTAEYETSPLRLPGAVRLHPDAIEAGIKELQAERGQLIVTYDTSPEESTAARVTQRLREQGWKNVRTLKGGLGGWTNARLPVEAKSHLPSIGLEIYKNLTVGDLERRRYRAGEQIFKEGTDPRGEAYLIHSGTVEIRRTFDGEDRLLNTLGEGELLGEMALFRQALRSASAFAATDVELLVIKTERLDWLIRNRPQLTTEVVRRLANWVVQTDRERALANR